MRGLRVSDLMTWPVIAARVTTPFKELVSLLEKNEISAVPVIDEHRRPIGVVTEADLLARHGEMTRESRIPFAGIRRRHARQAAHGLTARDLMTRHVRTVGRDDPAAGAARYLADARLHRLYVVDGSGRLVGVLARRDVLRAFLRPDEEIKEVVDREVFQRSIWVDPQAVTIRADDGVVTLEGTIDRRSQVERAEWLTERIPGVVAVVNRLKYLQDDGATADFR
ncbi:MAG TPA: CBS domain-containing protein [Amycolatopsis sp.]|nr:CBS domain-containing protein [Amycolatopsis sp.]